MLNTQVFRRGGSPVAGHIYTLNLDSERCIYDGRW